MKRLFAPNAATSTPSKTGSPSFSWTVPKKQNLKGLKIGFDARLAYRRGVGTYTANLLLALSRVDRQNQYAVFNAPEELRVQIHNPRFEWVDLPFGNPAQYEQWLLPKAARERGLDFLHYTDNSGTTFTDFPFVLTLHDAMHVRPLSRVRPKPSLWYRLVYAYKQWVVPRSARKAGQILTVSEYSKKEIERTTGVPEEKITITLEGVDRKAFAQKRRKPSKLFKILVHGAADDRKNLSNILKAAQIWKAKNLPFQLLIVGMDEAELKSTRYLQEAIDLDLGNLLEWVGNVTHDILRAIYADVDLFLYPSRLEGFGLPVLEAFSSGVPVVTSKTTSLPEVAGNAAALVDPENPEDIAQCVEKLYRKPALRKALVVKGLARAKQFTWEKTAQLTLPVYQRMGPREKKD